MPRSRDWIRRHKKTAAAAALGLALVVGVALGVFWFGWDWKELIGWRWLVDYIDPTDATTRKDAVQVYAVIVAGVVASITAAVGLLNLRLTRKNLEQQRELEAQRGKQQRELAQGSALQAYYEQIGKLITDMDLLNTQRKEIRELARGQTLTVLQEVDGQGKRSLLTFLHGAGLIGAENPAVALTGADFRGADLRGAVLLMANLQGADLHRANLQRADLRSADLYRADLQGAELQFAKLQFAKLPEANLQGANLRGADLYRAYLQGVNLRQADLAVTKLPEADLRNADLRNAKLDGSVLRGANLREAGLRGAILDGADLRGAILDGAIDLSQEQLVWTIGLNDTVLPQGLKRPQLWSKSIEEQRMLLQKRFPTYPPLGE